MITERRGGKKIYNTQLKCAITDFSMQKRLEAANRWQHRRYLYYTQASSSFFKVGVSNTILLVITWDLKHSLKNDKRSVRELSEIFHLGDTRKDKYRVDLRVDTGNNTKSKNCSLVVCSCQKYNKPRNKYILCVHTITNDARLLSTET
jgi:hypothetical protein